MKIWNAYGSEHSANLVMIGTFKDAASAEKAMEVIDEITEFITAQNVDFLDAERYPESVLDFLQKVGFHSVLPAELEQFRSGIYPKVENNKLVVATDEIDISAFLKLLIDKGARVEVYSAHDFPKTGLGRDTSEE